MDLPQRKPNRLKYRDYSKPGAYFVTVCTKGRRCILASTVVGAIIDRPQSEMMLSPYGVAVDNAIKEIAQHYENVYVDSYVIMPNHIHMILVLLPFEGGRSVIAPTVSDIVRHTKAYASRDIGFSIWQKSYHDHIIRNRDSFVKIRKYIQNNPATRQYDCLNITHTTK